MKILPTSDNHFASLEEAQALWEWVINNTDDWIWTVDAERFGLLSFNLSLQQYFLEKRAIHLTKGMRPEDLFPAGSSFVEAWTTFYRKALETGNFKCEYEVFAGTNILALDLHRLERDGRAVAVSVFAKDITREWQARRQLEQDRKQALENHERQRLILDSIPQSVFWKDVNGRYLGCNAAFARAAGLEHPDEIIGKTDFDLPWRAEDTKVYLAGDQTVVASKKPRMHIIEHYRSSDDVILFADTSKIPLINPQGDVYGVLGIFDDVTARHEAEARLTRVTKALQTRSAGSEALIRAVDETELMRRMVHILVEVGEYGCAWVGFRQHGHTDSMEVLARHADVAAKIALLTMPANIEMREDSIFSLGVQTGKVQLTRRLEGDTTLAPYSAAGFAVALVLPLTQVAQIDGVLSIFSRDPDAFGSDEVELLERLSQDLAYGIKNLRVAETERQTSDHLKHSLQETIGVIAATVESRDPYTAGHQRRVAKLAQAIAEAIGMNPHDVEGVVFAARIHDLGNMQVPAGILARPSGLSKAEFELIKTHPQIGFNIMKDIHLPWPVATMIQQHHERLDGTGYPQQLKGDEICLGARIIGVADVVEAMMSHRPYRTELSLEEALQEIQANRGSKYDPTVVDACVNLWRSGGFSFDHAS